MIVMVKSCCAHGCVNHLTKGSSFSFYRFPVDPDRRRRWITAINWKDWHPTKYSFVCSAHFVSGKKSNDPLSPDYVPSIFKHVSSPIKRKRVNAFQRYTERKKRKRVRQVQKEAERDEQARDKETQGRESDNEEKCMDNSDGDEQNLTVKDIGV